MPETTPSRLTPDEIRQVREIHRITDVLRRAGVDCPDTLGRDVMISCPTPGHEDTTPSCIVHPDSGTFHCFGCGAHGDVFALVREITGIRNLTHAAAVLEAGRPISWRAGTPVRTAALLARRPTDGPDLARTSRARIVEINALAWRYLTSDRLADQARAYLGRRGVDTSDLEGRVGEPLAGYTPASRTGLTDHLIRQGCAADELIDAGWTVRRPDRLVDRFHRRVLVPVRDPEGHVVGVIGRDITDHARSKYQNTPRTVAFSKRDALYRPFPARRVAVVVVCEGPLDALAIAACSARRGAATVLPVAPSGTALTTEQAALIADLRPREITVCADADPAGAAAAVSWSTLLRERGLSPRTVALPDGHDPASWLAHQGASGLDRVLGHVPEADSSRPRGGPTGISA